MKPNLKEIKEAVVAVDGSPNYDSETMLVPREKWQKLVNEVADFEKELQVSLTWLEKKWHPRKDTWKVERQAKIDLIRQILGVSP